MKNLFKTGCLAFSILFAIPSCKKGDRNNAASNQSIFTTSKSDVPKAVDQALLTKYIDYSSKLEATNLLKNSGTIPDDLPKMKMSEFDLMINNYLVNEANIMVENYNNTPHTNYADTVTLEPVVVTCTGGFTGMNTTNTILFQSNVIKSTSLANSSFAFGGFSGTWSQTGSLIQSVSQNVITYRQNYQETITENGVTYTQLYAIFGNVYQGLCTVHGMRIVAIQQ